MKKLILILTLIAGFLALTVSGAFAQDNPVENPTQKRGQTGMKFLSVSLDGRAAGMANAVTSTDIGSSVSMFYNPASMAYLDGNASVAFGKTQWIVDIDYDWGSVSFAPGQGKFGVFGLHLMAVNYGDITQTIRDDNERGYTDLGTFSPSSFVIGLGYAKALSDKFSVGGNLKYVSEDLGNSVVSFDGSAAVQQENKANAVAFDLGFLYRTGFRSLNFAMAVRNFASDKRYEEESFELPLTFSIGISMDLVDLTSMDKEMHSFLLSVDTQRPRDFAEQIKFGGEYTFRKFLSLRGGYITPTDEEGFSLGAGLNANLGNVGFNFDYAYTDFGVFDKVQRFSFQFGF